MEFLQTWIKQIVIALVLTSLLEMLLPGGRFKKYVRVVMGFFVILILIHPLLLLADKEEFTLFRLEGVDYKIEESSTKELEETRDRLIEEEFNRQMEAWVQNLLTVIPGVGDVDTEVRLSSTNRIEHLTVKVRAESEKSKKNEVVQKIEPVRIEIGGEVSRREGQKDTATSEMEQKIKERLSNFLGLAQEKITVIMLKE